MSLSRYSTECKPSRKRCNAPGTRDKKRFTMWPEVHTKHSIPAEGPSASPSPHTTPLLESPAGADDVREQRARWYLECDEYDQCERRHEAHWAIVAALVASTSIVVAFFVFVALAFVARGDVTVHHREDRTTTAEHRVAQLVAPALNVAAAARANFYMPQTSSKPMPIRSAYARCSTTTLTTSRAAVIIELPARDSSSYLSRRGCPRAGCD
ncbi:uncharacterized protein LOC144094617 [Amblyomma americanum]